MELSQKQIDRQDYVRGLIIELLVQLSGKQLEDDIELIAPVRDAIEDVFEERGIMDAMTFYPYVEEAGE